MPPGEEMIVPPGKHLLMRAKIDGKSVTRQYTPITPDSEKDKIHFLIKVYKDGLLSKYLESVKINDLVDIMGPVGTFQYNTINDQNILLIGGGTGITPLYQIIKHKLSDKSYGNMKLLYANNTEDDILLKNELEELVHDNFQVHHILVDPPTSEHNYKKGIVDKNIIKEYIQGIDTVLICGPPAMEKSIATILDNMNINKYITFTSLQKNEQNTPLNNDENGKELPFYTMEEVSKHDDEDDCWMVIKDKVYDVTKFVDEHPGGYIILDGAGKDSTYEFFEEFEHTEEAYDMLKQYLIGHLKK
eukprot:TRINITY_DN7278_c0_g1_i3.p1 TRINITY_DN7278_c0_g1~~TRINITY_DN7278_c0_g1_i3.p1  ORF type:complete len:302 (+),score=71.88 TRINITY_DN7278_c0_g1_i3:223-1128(+)